MKRRPNRNGARGVDPDAAPLSNRQQEANRRVSSLQSIPLKISKSVHRHPSHFNHEHRTQVIFNSFIPLFYSV